MGGCATKPKVSKDDPDVKAKAPEPEPELLKEDAVDEITKVPPESAEPQHDNTVDEDQTNKRRSLSLWFDKEVPIYLHTPSISTISTLSL